MYAGDHLERVGLPYVTTLSKMGIGITARTIEPSNYVSRLRRRKFDATILGIGGSLTPGVELRTTFGSYAADVDSSRNLMGIKDPVVDELIEKVIAAESRPKMIAAARALDRVLLWNFYGVPGFYAPGYRFIYWDRLSRPEVIGRYRPGISRHLVVGRGEGERSGSGQARAHRCGAPFNFTDRYLVGDDLIAATSATGGHDNVVRALVAKAHRCRVLVPWSHGAFDHAPAG